MLKPVLFSIFLACLAEFCVAQPRSKVYVATKFGFDTWQRDDILGGRHVYLVNLAMPFSSDLSGCRVGLCSHACRHCGFRSAPRI